MTTFLVLHHFTEAGIKAYKDTVKRADQFAKAAADEGCRVREVLWTMGAYDGALILEAPDDQTAARVLFKLSSNGFVRTQTLRAFTKAEAQAMIK